MVDFHILLTPAFDSIRAMRRGGDIDAGREAFNAAIKTAKAAIEPKYQDWPSDFVDAVRGWFADANEVAGLSAAGLGSKALEHSLGTRIGTFHSIAEGLQNGR